MSKKFLKKCENLLKSEILQNIQTFCAWYTKNFETWKIGKRKFSEELWKLVENKKYKVLIKENVENFKLKNKMKS